MDIKFVLFKMNVTYTSNRQLFAVYNADKFVGFVVYEWGKRPFADDIRVSHVSVDPR